MTSERVAYKLDQLGFVGRGRSRHRPRNDPSLYGGKYPFFQTGDVKSAEFYLSKYSATYSEKGLAQSKLWKAGTLCITIAANIAETAMLKIPGCFPDSVVGFVADPAKSDTAFVKYYLETLKISMQGVSRGTTQDNLSLDKLLSFDFLVPPVEEQKQIASVLLAYDDLIENNTRRIEILEEMARRLYEEWFVHFRFPGHQEVSFKESELGRIPEGWEVKGLYDIAEVTYGHPFKAKQFNDQGEGLGAVRIRDIRDGQVKTYTTEEGKPKHIIENGDILVGMDGQFHMGKWAGGKAWLVQRVARFRPTQPMSRYLLFLTIESPIKHLEETIVGTTVAHLSAKDLKAMKVVVPDEATLKMMADALEPMYELEMRLKRKNVNLRAQRDLLLPKLVSGEIDVSNIPMPDDKEVEAA